MVLFSSDSLSSPTAASLLSAAATITASVVLLRSVTDTIPGEFQAFVSSRLRRLSDRFSSELTVVIQESEGLTPNQMFSAANLYLGTKISASTRKIRVNKPEKERELAFSVDTNQEIADSFNGVRFRWVLLTAQINGAAGKGDRRLVSKTEERFFELTFHRKHKDTVLKAYLMYVLDKSKQIKEDLKVVRLHTYDYHQTDLWSCVALNHPASFETIAMDPDMKKKVIEDLDKFKRRKDYYRRVGKAWKRGYLLYGPPGTGKSSLIAAMANYLKFDIYDLDMEEMHYNSDLRRLLIGLPSKSILVIEDIDCTNVGVHNRESSEGVAEDEDKISLSGLLNFIDGLWSCCGDERIIVFTTNHKNRLDPALLRRGRMDVHIEMSYCTFSGFLTLARNYLNIEEHKLFGQIADLLSEVEVSPADIAGELMEDDNPDIALQILVDYLRSKKTEKSEDTDPHQTPK